MPDKEIPCAEAGCTDVRIFTEGEQKFFREKGMTEPKYCKPHSAARKAARENRENSPFTPVYEEMTHKSKKQPHTRHKGSYRGLGDREMYER